MYTTNEEVLVRCRTRKPPVTSIITTQPTMTVWSHTQSKPTHYNTHVSSEQLSTSLFNLTNSRLAASERSCPRTIDLDTDQQPWLQLSMAVCTLYTVQDHWRWYLDMEMAMRIAIKTTGKYLRLATESQY